MKRKIFSVLSGFLMLLCFVNQAAAAEASYDKLLREAREENIKKNAGKNKKPKSIWDDRSEANPYFKKQKSDTKKENKPQVKEPKRTTFKRRVYTGPSKEEISAAATKKAIANFKSFLTSDNYNVEYENISYDVKADSLSVSNMTLVPVERPMQTVKVPYLMKAESVVLRNFNIGEKNEKPLLQNGEMKIRKIEIPIWDDKAVKKGKIDIAQLRMNGDVPAYLKTGAGKLNALEVRDFRSEAIINETILNNIIRSKVFAASSANFTGVDLQKTIVNSLKRQELDGLQFELAQINGQVIPTVDGVKAAMTSYSARILNTDLVFGARLEAKKEKPNPNPDLELLKQNVAENKAAVDAVEAEVRK